MKDQSNQALDASPLSSDGVPEPKAFKDADACFNYAVRLEKWDEEFLAPKRALIQGFCLEGVRPWMEERTATQTNINWLEAENILDQRLLPYITRLNDSQTPIHVVPKERDPQLRDDWSLLISIGASEAYKTWRGNYTETLQAIGDMIDFGLGVVFWPSATDPRFERVARHNVFFEAGSPLDLEKIPSVVIRAEWTARTLAKLYYMSDEHLRNNGYEREGIEAALRHLAYQASKKEHDLKLETFVKRVQEDQFGEWSIAPLTVYQVAFRNLKTGKIDIYVTAPVSAFSGESRSFTEVHGQNAAYLRRKEGAYDKLSNFIGLLPLSGKTSTIAALRGHGHKIYPKALLTTRLKCRAIDDFSFGMTRWFEAGGAGDTMRTQVVAKGPYGFLPPGVKPVEMPKRDQTWDMMAMIGLTETELKRGVTGNFFEQQQEDQGRKSAFREHVDLINDSSLTTAEIGTFDLYFDPILGEFWRRLSNLTGEEGDDLREVFNALMEFHEVPPEVWAWKNTAEVFGERVIGGGSTAEQLNRSQTLVSMGNALGARGSHEAVESLVQTLVGARNVRRFIPAYDRLGEPSTHNWEANQESLAILGGQNVLPPYGNQRDEVHVAQHLQDFDPSIQRVVSGEVRGMEGIAPLAGGLAMLMPHLDVHMARLEADPVRRQIWDELRPKVEELRRMASALEKLVRDEMEARAIEAEKQAAMAPEQPTPEQLKAQQQMAFKDAEFQQKSQQKEVNFQRTQEEKQQAFSLAEARKDQQALRDAQRKALETTVNETGNNE